MKCPACKQLDYKPPCECGIPPTLAAKMIEDREKELKKYKRNGNRPEYVRNENPMFAKEPRHE